MSQNEFEKALLELGIELSFTQKEQLHRFYCFLVEKNKVMNLTRIIEEEEVYLKHFYDSLTLVKVVNLQQAKTLCDVGSGAGFPGVVLKICFPHLEVVLLDALQKRVNYLNELTNYLGLSGIEAIHLRGEHYHKKTFDIVCARAVASLDKLLPICMPLVDKTGVFVAMKANVEEELTASMNVLKKKKIKLKENKVFTLPKENSKRTLLVFEHLS